jgi:hypothetical protein
MSRRTKLLVAGVLAAAASPWLPGWLAAAGLDVWNAPALRRQVDANLRREAELAADIVDVQEQIRAKEALADELIAGRLSLAAATDRFGAMLDARPAMRRGLRCLYPDVTSDRELVARHVMDYARSRSNDQGERSRVAERMTTEFGTLFPGRVTGGTG